MTPMPTRPAGAPGERAVLVVLPSVIGAGAELQAMLQLRLLARRGVPVRLMVLSRIVEPPVLAQAELPADHLCVLDNPASTLGTSFLRNLWRDLPGAAAFARRQRVGTVIAHLPPAHFFARILFLFMLLRGRRCRLVHYHHSLEHKLHPHDTVGKRLFAAFGNLMGRACDHAHWHVSDEVRRDIAHSFTRRAAIIHNTCDMDAPGDPQAARRLLAPLRGRGSPYIVLVPGRLRFMKGHALFVRALARLCEAEAITPAALQVLVAGEGEERPRIEAEIARLGLADHVTLAGALPHPVLLALYGEAELVVVPSLNEGFGIVAIEAIARGALVVASDAGGLREVVRHGENGLAFPAGDEAALLDRLRQAWRQRGEPVVDREAARRDCISRFGPEAHVDHLLALLGR